MHPPAASRARAAAPPRGGGSPPHAAKAHARQAAVKKLLTMVLNEILQGMGGLLRLASPRSPSLAASRHRNARALEEARNTFLRETGVRDCSTNWRNGAGSDMASADAVERSDFSRDGMENPNLPDPLLPRRAALAAHCREPMWQGRANLATPSGLGGRWHGLEGSHILRPL